MRLSITGTFWKRSKRPCIKKHNTLNTKLSAKWDIPWVEGLTANAMFNYRRYYENENGREEIYIIYT